jgi:hypothetical protein
VCHHRDNERSDMDLLVCASPVSVYTEATEWSSTALLLPAYFHVVSRLALAVTWMGNRLVASAGARAPYTTGHVTFLHLLGRPYKFKV